MWEAVASALLIHLGKKTIDWLWSERRSDAYPVVSPENKGHAVSDAERTKIGREFAVAPYQQYETLFGNLYLPETLQDWIEDDEIVLVLVIEETGQQVMLFEADMNGYEIDLPHGNYSIFIFLMDPTEEDFLYAEIYAIGFPCAEHIDLSNIGSFSTERYEDIWDFLDASPRQITRGGPFYLDFILIDTDEEPNFPKSFSELVDLLVKQACE